MSNKAHTNTLIRALKATLKSRSITYDELARRLKLSHASVKRLFAEETFTLKRIEDICNVLEIDFFDLARLARGASADTDEMTTAQEQALADDARLLGMFYLVFNEWTFEEILDTYDINKAECTKLLLQLDKLRLIELGANNALRLKVPRTIRLQRDGLIRRSHGKSVINDFLQVEFAEVTDISVSSFATCRAPPLCISNGNSNGSRRNSTSWLNSMATCRLTSGRPLAWHSACVRGRWRG